MLISRFMLSSWYTKSLRVSQLTIILIYHSLSLAAAPQFSLCLKQGAFVPLPSNRDPSV